jgi:C4-dicarboxylate transporter DctM subunit
MLTGMPISIALGLTVLTFLFFLTSVPIEAVALKLFTGIEKFEIMAIPFFILPATSSPGGVAKRMINFATSMVGHWHGGLGLAGVMACALFAAISGSSPATVIAIGSILMPAMVAQGFPKRFGAGVITTSGALGILIPPSIVMVIYAVATGGSVALGPGGERVTSASVGQLFMAGVIPGLMLATLLGLTTVYRAWKFDYPRLPRASWRERIRRFAMYLGVAADRDRARRHLRRPVHADGSCRHERGLCVHHRGVRLQGLTLKDVPRVLLGSANMSAMISTSSPMRCCSRS